MTSPLPEIWLVRHGETEWSVSGQHTGRTDIPLTAEGQLPVGLAPGSRDGASRPSCPAHPNERSAPECSRVSASSAKSAPISPNGTTAPTKARRRRRSSSPTLAGGCFAMVVQPAKPRRTWAPAGIDLAELRNSAGDLLIFSSAHIMRVLAARWLGLPADDGALMVLNTASISVLGYEHDVMEPVLRSWNVVNASR